MGKIAMKMRMKMKWNLKIKNRREVPKEHKTVNNIIFYIYSISHMKRRDDHSFLVAQE